eukprot:1858343-Prymnesium_polylepis.1
MLASSEPLPPRTLRIASTVRTPSRAVVATKEKWHAASSSFCARRQGRGGGAAAAGRCSRRTDARSARAAGRVHPVRAVFRTTPTRFPVTGASPALRPWRRPCA